MPRITLSPENSIKQYQLSIPETVTIVSRREISEKKVKKCILLATQVFNKAYENEEALRNSLSELRKKGIAIHSKTINLFIKHNLQLSKEYFLILIKSGLPTSALEKINTVDFNLLDEEVIEEVFKLKDERLIDRLLLRLADNTKKLDLKKLTALFSVLTSYQVNRAFNKNPLGVGRLFKKVYLAQNLQLINQANALKPQGLYRIFLEICEYHELDQIFENFFAPSASELSNALNLNNLSSSNLKMKLYLLIKYNHYQLVKNIFFTDFPNNIDTWEYLIIRIIKNDNRQWYKILTDIAKQNDLFSKTIKETIAKENKSDLELYIKSKGLYFPPQNYLNPGEIQYKLTEYILNWINDPKTTAGLLPFRHMETVEEPNIRSEIEYVIDILAVFTQNQFLRLPFYGAIESGSNAFENTAYELPQADPFGFSRLLFTMATEEHLKADVRERAREVLQILSKKDPQLAKYAKSIVTNRNLKQIDKLKAKEGTFIRTVKPHTILTKNKTFVSAFIGNEYGHVTVTQLNKQGWGIAKIILPDPESAPDFYKPFLEEILLSLFMSEYFTDISIEKVNFTQTIFIQDIMYINKDKMIVPNSQLNTTVFDFLNTVVAIDDSKDLNKESFMGIIEENVLTDDIVNCDFPVSLARIASKLYFEGGNLVKAQNQDGIWYTIVGSHNILASYIVFEREGYFASLESKIKTKLLELDLANSKEEYSWHMETIHDYCMAKVEEFDELSEKEQEDYIFDVIAKIEVIRDLFQEEFGKVLFLGSGYGFDQSQIGFHIDLDIASAPNGVIFVNDYQLGETLIFEILKDEKLSELERFQLNIILNNLKQKKIYQEILQQYVEELECENFNVIQVPARFGTNKDAICFTNMITGVKEDKVFALVPSFNSIPGESLLRDVYAEALKKGGIEEVYFVGHNFRNTIDRPDSYEPSHVLIDSMGSLHCITQVIRE